MPPDTQIGRTAIGGRPSDHRPGLVRIGGHDDGQVRDGAQPGQVFDGVVGGAEFTLGHPRALPAENNTCLAVCDVRLDLLQSATREEGSRSADEGDHPAVGETGADPDEVLLGDPDVDQPVREFLPELRQIARAHRVVADRDMRSSSRASAMSSSANAFRQS